MLLLPHPWRPCTRCIRFSLRFFFYSAMFTHPICHRIIQLTFFCKNPRLEFKISPVDPDVDYPHCNSVGKICNVHSPVWILYTEWEMYCQFTCINCRMLLDPVKIQAWNLHLLADWILCKHSGHNLTSASVLILPRVHSHAKSVDLSVQICGEICAIG